MEQYNPKNWISLVFTPHRGYVRKYLIPNVLLMGIYSFSVVYIFHGVYRIEWVLKIGVHSLLGIVLGFILVFRTNTAYDRWWEGRKLLGALTNHSRSFSLKLASMLDHRQVEDRKFFARIISDFAHSLKEHLRGNAKPDDLDQEVYPETAFEGTPHIPNRILALMHNRIADLFRAGKIGAEPYKLLGRDLEGFTDVLGGCERIKNTPIPISYSIYIKKFIFFYLITLPLGFKEEYDYWTVPAVMFITYVILGLEIAAEEIEDPFGKDENDLPTDEIAINIRANVHEILKVETQTSEKR